MGTDSRLARSLLAAARGGLGGMIGGAVASLLTGGTTWQALAFTSAGCGLLVAIIAGVGIGIAGSKRGAAIGGLAGIALALFLSQRLGGAAISREPKPAADEFKLAIAGPTLDGKTFDLSQWRGKVVLVDFWATWCGPCLAELPNVHEVYDRHHAEGFEIIGVSLDQKRARLAAFVKDHEIPWPQIFFDEPGKQAWNNPLVRDYKIDAIPATYLIDAQGKVVASEVRGTMLEPAVMKLLGQATPSSTPVAAALVIQHIVIPVQLLLAVLLGCVGGSVLGALAQRRTSPITSSE